MAGTIYSGTYTNTIVLDQTVQQNPATLTGVITVNGTNAASDSGFYSNAASPFSITNLGRITATGVTSYGILLLSGGTIDNGAAGSPLGLIQSDETGILLSGSLTSSVTNDGTIIGTAGRGVFLQGGGTLDNAATSATILGGFEGVAIYNLGGVLTNAGTITDTGTAGLGVEMYAGTVTNLAGGQIGGVYGVGFVAQHATGTLSNDGTIIGTGRDGVELSDGGTVSNAGVLAGAVAGVLALYGPASVSNSGAISGLYAGIDLLVGGAVVNAAGGSITGAFGVSMGNGATAGASGTLTNAGLISGGTYQGVSLNDGGGVVNSGSIYGASAGVASFYGSAAVTNSGEIGARFVGVDLAAGGTITNETGATLAGTYGVIVSDGPPSGVGVAPSSLSNAGLITGSGTAGVDILTTVDAVNAAGGTIVGGRYGVDIVSVAGTIANYGLITGQTGIYSAPVVANNQHDMAQITLINAGTIIGSGGVAVSMYDSHDLLIDRPGAVFQGSVIGGGGRLELTSGGAGTLGTLGEALAGFGSITADSGANWSVDGTIAAAATLTDLGAMTVQNSAVLTDLGVISDGGSLTGGITLRTDGTLLVSGTVQSGLSILFGDATGHLALTSPMTVYAPIKGFSAGDTIYLPDESLTGLTESFTPSANGGTLALSQFGSTIARLTLDGSYTTDSFTLRADPNGGTDVLIPCFLSGTRIATADGDRRVERLRVGTEVVTASGALRPIVWIGHRRVDVARHRAPNSVRPVCIAAHAFAPDQPRRDLFLSPDHAVYYAGVLIPAHLLVNGRSVRRGPVGQARYYHLELDQHDVLLAEGLAVESYLDTGNRDLLGIVTDRVRRPGLPCAPLMLGGSAVARARRHLLVRACRLPAEAAPLELEVDGHPVAPVRREAGRLVFLLPAGARRVVLMTAQPRWLGAAILDGRWLDPAGPTHSSGFDPAGPDEAPTTRIIDGRASLLLDPARNAPGSLELILLPEQAAA